MNNHISDSDFELFKKLMYDSAGIFLSDAKKILVANRLNKRLRELNIDSHNKYYYICKKSNDEKWKCNESLTTNETFFYREPKHWDFLENKFIPEITGKVNPEKKFDLKIWSCASSTGEEPYTIAMLLKEKLMNFANITFQITATDINEKVIAFAKNGIYEQRRVEQLPKNLLLKYFTVNSQQYKISADIKKGVQFKKHNLMEQLKNEKFDLIVCRNVLIYFDDLHKKKVIANLKNNLNPGGYLFLGHSEGIANIDNDFKFISASIYKFLK